MSVTGDILRSWRAPRAVMRGLLAAGPREDRSLAFLMLACLLLFLAQWPRLAREAALAPEVPLEARLGGALMATLFLLPLIAYGIAGLSRILLQLAGWRVAWAAARLALFWAMLATGPLALLHGIAAVVLPPGPALTLAGIAVAAAFLLIWGACLREAALEAPAARA